MDEQTTRDRIQAHADAVVSGDIETVTNDFSEPLRPQVPQIAQSLPQPVKVAEVLSVEFVGEEAVAKIRYSGGDKAQTIRTHWQEIDGQPQIVDGEPVD
jgi:hypothetical protein